MTLSNVNAKILLEKAVQEYYRSQIKFRDERLVVRRIAAFDLYVGQGLKLKEVAEILGVKPTTVDRDVAVISRNLRWYMTRMFKINNVAEALQ